MMSHCANLAWKTLYPQPPYRLKEVPRYLTPALVLACGVSYFPACPMPKGPTTIFWLNSKTLVKSECSRAYSVVREKMDYP